MCKARKTRREDAHAARCRPSSRERPKEARKTALNGTETGAQAASDKTTSDETAFNAAAYDGGWLAAHDVPISPLPHGAAQYAGVFIAFNVYTGRTYHKVPYEICVRRLSCVVKLL